MSYNLGTRVIANPSWYALYVFFDDVLQCYRARVIRRRPFGLARVSAEQGDPFKSPLPGSEVAHDGTIWILKRFYHVPRTPRD